MKTLLPKDITDADRPFLACRANPDGTVTLYYQGDAIPPMPVPPPSNVPAAVPMRKARLALQSAGLLASVEAAINSLPEPQKTQTRITWEYSSEVQRNFGLVADMGAALGLTSKQLDDLFIAADALP